MNNPAFETSLVPLAKILLLASLGISFLAIVRGRTTYQQVIEAVLIGWLGLLFYKSGLKTLQQLSQSLMAFVQALGREQDLRAVLLDSFKRAAAEPQATVMGPSTLNIPSMVEQAWRSGIWGVMSAAVDWFFLVSSFVLESAQHVLWMLLTLLFPIGCGVFPVFPRILKNLSLYAVELSLWLPVLCLVERATSEVAKLALNRSESLGLYLVAVELIAIFLILSIPTITHRFLNGAVNGDLGLHSGVVGAARKGIAMAAGMGL